MPGLVRRKSQDRRKQSAKRIENLVHGRLGGPPARRTGQVAIHPVFRDIHVETAQVDRTKLIERVINLVKFEGRVGGATFRDNVIEPLQDPSIDQRGRRGRPCAGVRDGRSIKIVEIA